MGILGANSFQGRGANEDGLAVLAGVPTWANVGPGSVPAVTGTNFTMESPWISGDLVLATRREPTGTAYWVFLYLQMYYNRADNNPTHCGVSRSGTELITLSFEDFTLEPTLRVAGTVVATSSGFASVERVFRKYSIQVEGHAAGDVVRVYVDGSFATPAIAYTLTAPDAAALAGKPNATYFRTGSAIVRLTAQFALDPADAVAPTDMTLLANANVVKQPPNSNSAAYAGMTGSYTDIDEVPFNAADSVEATAINQVSTFGHAVAPQDMVHFVQTKWGVTRAGTDAGSQLQPRVNSAAVPATFQEEPAIVIPGAGNLIIQHHVAPDGGAWDKAKYDDMQFGMASRT